MGEDVDSPIEVLTFLLGEGDDDGRGTVERSVFRDYFQVACDKMGVKGLEEGELRRLMDRFQTPDERVSYLDFVKVLRSDIGSPKKFSAAPTSNSYAPLVSRVKETMAAKNMGPMMLKEHFLPGDIMGPHETSIPFSELETVFAVDLGIMLDPSDEKDIMENFGVGEGEAGRGNDQSYSRSHPTLTFPPSPAFADNVDIKSLMTSWGIWVKGTSAALGDTATHLKDWSTTIPRSRPDVPTLPISTAPAAKPFTRPHYTQYDTQPKNVYESAPAPVPAPAATSSYQRPAATNSYQPQPSHAPYSPPPPHQSNVEPVPNADNEYVRKLQMENDKLKSGEIGRGAKQQQNRNTAFLHN